MLRLLSSVVLVTIMALIPLVLLHGRYTYPTKSKKNAFFVVETSESMLILSDGMYKINFELDFMVVKWWMWQQ